MKRAAGTSSATRSKKSKQVVKSSTKPYAYTRTTVPKSIVDLGVGLPQRVKITHKYSQNGVLTTNATPGTANFTAWEANGIYDIINSDQAYYFDQLAGLYSSYSVIGSRATIKVNGGSDLVFIAFARQPAAVAGTNSVERLASQAGGTISMAVGGAPPTTLTANYSAKAVYGGSTISDPALLGTDTANPSDGQQFVLGYTSNSASLVFFFTITIEYITIWENKKQVPESEV